MFIWQLPICADFGSRLRSNVNSLVLRECADGEEVDLSDLPEPIHWQVTSYESPTTSMTPNDDDNDCTTTLCLKDALSDWFSRSV